MKDLEKQGMAQPGRLGMTDVQKSELWQRWRNGESIIEISRALAADRKAVSRVLSRHGGFTPPLRKRSAKALTLAEREEISRGLSAEHSQRQIAEALQRSPSTISREVARNGGRQRYRGTEADKVAWAHARHPKIYRLVTDMVPMASFRILYVFLVLRHDRRGVVHFNVTEHPTAQ